MDVVIFVSSKVLFIPDQNSIEIGLVGQAEGNYSCNRYNLVVQAIQTN